MNPRLAKSVSLSKWPTLWLMLAGMLLLLASAAAKAENYNDGFIAAEKGDYKSALQYWGPLADQGNAAAQFNVGTLYHGGLGVNLDEAKAIEWYKKSAKNGYHKAQEYLSAGYREGWFGLPKDKAKADYWDQQLDNQSQK